MKRFSSQAMGKCFKSINNQAWKDSKIMTLLSTYAGAKSTITM